MNNALTIYDNALGFANVYRLLRDKTSPENMAKEPTYVIGSMIIPTLVNGVFACELFLKALLKQPIKCHSLVKLFEKLYEEEPEQAELIKAVCINIMIATFHKNDYCEKNFKNDLETYDLAFEGLRYWHEPTDLNKAIRESYSLSFIETFVAVLQTQCKNKYGERPLVCQ